ncbi:hypothetical protein CVIRNUC_009145 [Coccomyxa viridis]|uniref:RNA-binding protein 8A n=1 Tax=Coccomyxa viridis TaxID=1274662 RepID=A0AAV1IGW7_9CHLO|nr:hypothetical protein CVIRNUC_009145 [Coccomyxa viridis]
MARREQYDDDMMDAEQPQRVRSTVSSVRKQKGRGFRERMETDDTRNGARGSYDTLEAGSGPGPAKSVEGWVIFVTGINEEAGEEDIHDTFAEYGEVKNIYLNLDRRTGYVKGYAMVEYATKKEAEDAISSMNGQEFMTQPLQVTWCFTKGPARKRGGRR